MPPPPITKPAGRRCIVAGRVQGVFYRASAQQRARLAGIVGHARNLPDGTVEVLACGEHGEVEEFVAWLWKGPSAAKVAAVTIETAEMEQSGWPTGFTTF